MLFIVYHVFHEVAEENQKCFSSLRYNVAVYWIENFIPIRVFRCVEFSNVLTM